MESNNLLGIYSFFGFRLPLIKKLDLIKEAGFEATTLWWGDEIAFSEVNKDNLASTVRERGLYLENIHVPYTYINKLFSDSQKEREQTLKQYLYWIEDCARYEIPLMVMHITDGIQLPPPGKYLYDSYKKIVKTAKDYDVKVAVENTERIDYLNFILKEFVSEQLGFCYDSSHAQLTSKNNVDILKKWNHRLFAVHLSDNDGQKDRHWLPDKGIVNWDEVCSNLANYKGCITLETFAHVDTTAEKFLKKAHKKAAKIRAMIINR